MQNYFTLDEMACKGRPQFGFPVIAYPDNFVANGTWGKLNPMLNETRELWGDVLHTLSGYRSPDYNAWLRQRSINELITKGRTPAQAELETGVAKQSLHMSGLAADLQPSNPSDSPKLFDLIMLAIKSGKLKNVGGVGWYPTWVHVDVRPRLPGGLITTWGKHGS